MTGRRRLEGHGARLSRVTTPRRSLGPEPNASQCTSAWYLSVSTRSVRALKAVVSRYSDSGVEIHVPASSPSPKRQLPSSRIERSLARVRHPTRNDRRSGLCCVSAYIIHGNNTALSEIANLCPFKQSDELILSVSLGCGECLPDETQESMRDRASFPWCIEPTRSPQRTSAKSFWAGPYSLKPFLKVQVKSWVRSPKSDPDIWVKHRLPAETAVDRQPPPPRYIAETRS